jgi:glycosyltransferase involved in cell wall biosynthesis
MGLRALTVGASRADPRIAARLARLIRAEGFQVLDAQNPQSKLWGALAAKWGGAAFVATLNSWAGNEYRDTFRGWFYTRLERSLRRLTDLHIAVSPEILERLYEDRVPARACVLIHNAVEIDPGAIQDARGTLIESFHLPIDAILCCAVGRLVEAKAHDVLIASMGLLTGQYPRLHCLIVGDGPLRDVLQGQVAQAGLQDRIHFLGFRDHSEVLEIVKACEIFIMPSRSEGTPVALLEAAALARPIVATRVGGIPDILTHGEHGWLVEAGNAEALAHALQQVVDHPAEAAVLGVNGQERVRQDFSLTAQVNATLDAYRQALVLHQQHRSKRGAIPSS